MADRFAAIAVAFATGPVTVTGAKWHAEDLRAGGDIAAHARRRRTPASALRSGRDRRRIRHGPVITNRGTQVSQAHGDVGRVWPTSRVGPPGLEPGSDGL
jgi:hypothetical protein